MTNPPHADLYRAYLDCLNRQDWTRLGRHVADDVHHNGQPLGLSGYRQMLVRDFDAIPDLRFEATLLVADDACVAARLAFDCTPVSLLFGLPVNGRRVTFTENVFYEFRVGKIARVWSVIDQAAVAAQLGLAPSAVVARRTPVA